MRDVFVGVALYFPMMICLAKYLQFDRFDRKPAYNNGECAVENRVFTATNVSEFQCLIGCSVNNTCFTVFYDVSQLQCYGCNVVYSGTLQPNVLLAGMMSTAYVFVPGRQMTILRAVTLQRMIERMRCVWKFRKIQLIRTMFECLNPSYRRWSVSIAFITVYVGYASVWVTHA